jgi:leucyl-tRNA synthetase
MRTLFKTLALACAALALTACANSGFQVATTANTSRADDYQLNILTQAGNDLTAINDCYLRAAGYVRVGGSANGLQKVSEPGSTEGCTVMATALRTQSNMMTFMAPHIAQVLMSRVPAAPEEIAADLLKFGVKAALLKFGVEQVAGVITNGQAAQAEIAQAGIAAASKPPLIVRPEVVHATGAASVTKPLDIPYKGD